jgi:hypothetical protein
VSCTGEIESYRLTIGIDVIEPAKKCGDAIDRYPWARKEISGKHMPDAAGVGGTYSYVDERAF